MAKADDRRGALFDSHGDDEVRAGGVWHDVAHEGVVEQVDLPAALIVVPDLGRTGLPAGLEARDGVRVAVEVDLGR